MSRSRQFVVSLLLGLRLVFLVFFVTLGILVFTAMANGLSEKSEWTAPQIASVSSTGSPEFEQKE